MKPLPCHFPRHILIALVVAASLIFISLCSSGLAADVTIPEQVTIDAYEGYSQPQYTGIAIQMDVPLETVSLHWQSQWMTVTADADWQTAHPDMPLLVTIFPGMPEGIHTDTITIIAQDGSTNVIPIVFTVRSNRLITPDQITFGEVYGYTGEVSTAVQISIDGAVSNLQATSSNPNISASLSSSSMNSGDHALLTIKARNGLDAGEHTALITLTGDHCTGVIPVTFSVNIAKSLHAPQGVSFSAIHGYAGSPETTAEVGVSGTAANLRIDSDNRSIEVSVSPTNINGGEKAIITFRAANGLPIGKHTAYVVLSADGFLPETFPVTFTVNQSNSLSVSSEVAFSLREGYQGQPSTTVQVGVNGTASNIRVSSSNPAIEAFIQPNTISSGQTATLTLRAQSALAINRYIGVITLTANECSTNVSVVLNVEVDDSASDIVWITEDDDAQSDQEASALETPAVDLANAQSEQIDTASETSVLDESKTSTQAPVSASSAAQSTDSATLPITVNVMDRAGATATAAPVAPVAQSKSGSIFNCKEWVYVRSGPGTEYPAIDHASLGESLELLEWNSTQDWCRVRLVNQGGEGWVHTKFIRKH